MTTFYPSVAAIERVGLGLLDRSLPKPEWTHAAHFAATLWLMRTRPGIDLAAEMPGIIRGYNEAVGGVNSDTEGYHETITQASLRAARAFLDGRAEEEPLHESVDALMASPLGQKDWLLGHWSRGRLFSVEARRGWVEPDVQALPW
jgi:hypothetical protein